MNLFKKKEVSVETMATKYVVYFNTPAEREGSDSYRSVFVNPIEFATLEQAKEYALTLAKSKTVFIAELNPLLKYTPGEPIVSACGQR